MKLRTIIIDDEPIALDKLRTYVSKTSWLELVGAYSNATEALETLTVNTNIDVIFTDISMPDIDGMEMIRAMQNPPMVVFITAYNDYAAESYKLSAIDYLLKPYSLSDFQRAACKVLENYKLHNHETPTASTERPSIFVKTDYRYLRINLADIRYIKGFGEYLQIYTTNSSNPILTLSSFAAIYDKLSSSFLQVHRSYIVNMDNVTHIERSRIIMDSETYIPVSDSYKSSLQNYLAGISIGGTSK